MQDPKTSGGGGWALELETNSGPARAASWHEGAPPRRKRPDLWVTMRARHRVGSARIFYVCAYPGRVPAPPLLDLAAALCVARPARSVQRKRPRYNPNAVPWNRIPARSWRRSLAVLYEV